MHGDAALERCFRAVPVKSLSEVRPAHGAVALRCHTHGCSACADFDVNHRAQFEETALPKDTTVWSWDCDVEPQRALAIDAGAVSLPTYIVVPATGPIVVHDPVARTTTNARV